MTTRLLILALLVSAASTVGAQMRRPQAVLTPALTGVTATEARLTLRVKLPDSIHVQSNKPRDPLFIPTTLTLDVPKGITVAEIRYPEPSDLTQAGLKEPLSVFGSDFTIDVRLTIAADAARGDVALPGRLRYQACDVKMCYPPARGTVSWTIAAGERGGAR